jgi:hypothetical protein
VSKPERIAKDKAERKSRGGTLSSVLGADGYNPSGMSASIAKDFENDERAAKIASANESDASTIAASAEKKAKQNGSDPMLDFDGAIQVVDSSIDTISKYKVIG